MLVITIEPCEMWDDATDEFVTISKPKTLRLEHSLLAISMWEQKYRKPFMSDYKKNLEETQYYIKCMAIDHNVTDVDLKMLTPEDYSSISKYMNTPRTACKTISSKSDSQSDITSDLIYCRLVECKIPFDVEKWHISRVLKLIELVATRSMSPEERRKAQSISASEMHELNEKQRKRILKQ